MPTVKASRVVPSMVGSSVLTVPPVTKRIVSARVCAEAGAASSAADNAIAVTAKKGTRAWVMGSLSMERW